CLLLSHNFIALILMPFYFAFVFFLLWQEEMKKKISLLILTSFSLFLGLTCYFWLPALWEKKDTLVDTILIRELASYKLHFVYLRQLWNSPWGYGGSIFGLEDGISFEVGKLHLILSLLAGILGLSLLIKKEKGGWLISFFFGLFAFSLFMTSFHSQFIWDFLKPLWYLQFPWRFLIFSVFFASILSGGVISHLFSQLKKRVRLKWLMLVGVGILVICLNKAYFLPASYLEVDDHYYTSEEDLKWRVSGFSFEFVPEGVATRLSDIGTTQLDISQDEIGKTSFEVLDGDLEVEETINFPHKKVFVTNGKGKLRVNVYSFPGWKARIDQKEVGIEETGKLKLVTLDVPEGEHRVEVVFTDTPVRRTANLVSLMSMATLFLAGGLGVKKSFQ
ncbi:MAG TPA: hypothetical protein VMX77_01325, partial [Candidatus Bathyarchaeia archaeon]|nr:hypothetical protein [Candidatus Bathyarchaeia archaeon]